MLIHYFSLYAWPFTALADRQLQLLIKSVKINKKMNVRLKGVFFIDMLSELMFMVGDIDNGLVYQALFAMAF